MGTRKIYALLGDEDSILGCISLVSLALGNDIDILDPVDPKSIERCEIQPKGLFPVPELGDGVGGDIYSDNRPNIAQPPQSKPEKEKEDEQDDQEISDEQDDEKDDKPVANDKDEPVIELEPKVPLPENNTIPLKAQDEGGLKIGSGVITGGKKQGKNIKKEKLHFRA